MFMLAVTVPSELNIRQPGSEYACAASEYRLIEDNVAKVRRSLTQDPAWCFFIFIQVMLAFIA